MPRSPKPPLPARQPPVVAEPAPEDDGGEEAAADEPVEIDVEPVEVALELPEGGDGDEGAEATLTTFDEPTPATAKRSLARFDPLTQYINEIRRYPLLTREQEHDLAVRYANSGDVEAARRLITSNLRLVVKIAHEYRRAHRNLLDLVQEGNVGLLQAVRKYDPFRGVKLSSYAAWWIRAYILKFILNNWRLVKLGTTQAQRKLFFNLRKEKEKLEAAGYAPEAKLLAERLEVSEAEVREMDSRLASGEMSLDTPVGRDDEGGASHLDMLESPSDTRPDVAAEGDEFRALLRRKLDAFEETLAGRELTIFQERLHAETPLTLQEIGDKYGISRERARQLEKRLTDKLRVFLRQELGDAVEIAMGLEE